ncbi:MAG: NfeD family protein [Albidovulum sp.]|nr:NfeD family protein [Albidovulum sp.]MDE0534071.1 NfeD family protein [Albidovulum sp.]
MFGFLEGISPLWWIAFGFALGGVELLAPSYFLVWPALAAFALGGWLAFAPGLSGNVQVGIFAASSVVLTIAGRWAMSRLDRRDRDASALNDRSSQMIGRRAYVIEFDGSEGKIEIDGTLWKARTDGTSKVASGDHVRVVGNKGSVLFVEND